MFSPLTKTSNNFNSHDLLIFIYGTRCKARVVVLLKSGLGYKGKMLIFLQDLVNMSQCHYDILAFLQCNAGKR
ncbi:hypothetical protein Hanom_Chr04g00363821 [Helianthus anomalus]